MSDHELWSRLIAAGSMERHPIKEKLSAILRAGTMPEKFWDKDLRRLKEMGALEVLRRMVGTSSTPTPSTHEFFQAVGRCNKI